MSGQRLLGLVRGLLAPGIDSAVNRYMRDVIGNKSDTVGGDSIVSLIKILDAVADLIQAETDKIDSAVTDGLAGTVNSLTYRVHEIEKHFHNNDCYFGDGGSNDLAVNLTEIQIAAETGLAFGSELQIHDGSTIIAGMTKLDLGKMLVTAISATSKVYLFQFWAGAGAFGDATLVCEDVGFFPASTGRSVSIPLRCARFNMSDKLWVRSKCETNGATLDFLPGLHGYVA